LVTGCAGFIGSSFTEFLLSKGKAVAGIDNFNDYYDPKFKEENISGLAQDKNFTLYRADTRDKNALEKIFKENEIEKVVHLAARAGVRASMEQPNLYVDVNVNGTTNLLEAARKHGVKQFVFASSSSVYGLNETPWSEEQRVESQISPYAATKIAGERMCYAYHSLYGLPVTCLRFFTVYGPRGRPDMAVYKFTDLIAHGKPIEKYGNGKSQRDYTFIADIVRGVNASVEKKFPFEIVNLGNSRPVELNYLISLIEKGVGKKATYVEKPMPKADVPITYADISKAKKLLDWEPGTTIEEGVSKFIEWFNENRL